MEFHEDLKISPGESKILKGLAAGLTLKEVAASLNKSPNALKQRMFDCRKKNKSWTTEKMMYWLGRSGQLENRISEFNYEFPIGI